MIVSAEYGIFMSKTNSESGLQQHIHQEQSILRQISNVEHQRMLLSGKPIQPFFIKLLKNLEKQTYISLLLELINIGWICVLASGNQRQWLSMPFLLPGTTMISTCSTFQTCRLNISDDLHRQGKCNRSTHTGTCSCYR